MNEYQFKRVNVEREFVWHDHPDTDEVIDETLNTDFRATLMSLESGELFVIPKGAEHEPVAYSECRIMIVEPKGVLILVAQPVS